MAGSLNIAIEQGATFSMPVSWADENEDPIDLTGSTVTMQLRTAYDAASAALSLTSVASAGIAIDSPATLGSLTVTITDEQTATLAAPATYVYDLRVSRADGTVKRLLSGKAVVSPSVTR